MNPSSAGMWNNPPPPGTELQEQEGDLSATEEPKDGERSTDRLQPYVKSPDYGTCEKYDRSRRHRSNSKPRDLHSGSQPKGQDVKSRDRKYKSRHRSRSRSRDRHRRSRSRSRGKHHRRRNSASRTSSRSPSRRHRRHRRSSSRASRSRSRSRGHRHRHSKHSRHSRNRDLHSRTSSDLAEEKDEESDDGADDDEPASKENTFKNDGSFLEMFKKMQEEQQKVEAEKQENLPSASEPKKPPAFGKRRGGRVLKTGLVQKSKAINETDLSEPQDAWSIYMKEVKRYKEACCDDDSKTRPLVK